MIPLHSTPAPLRSPVQPQKMFQKTIVRRARLLEQALRLQEEGKTVKDIADITGYSAVHIYKVLAAHKREQEKPVAPEPFITSFILLAAYLAMYGFEPEREEVSNVADPLRPAYTFFSYAPSEPLVECVRAFHNGGQVEARAYAEMLTRFYRLAASHRRTNEA